MHMIKKWITRSEQLAQNLKIFDAKWVERQHPDWKKTSNFVVLDSPLWVNIIPITKDGNVVFVEQYRHGVDDITLEIPGGLIEKGEDPRIAGQRECREETGFISDQDAILLGESLPNPAFMNNICYSYVWFDCERKLEQDLDGNEDINIIEYPLNEIRHLILEGKVDHSLVLTAFFYYSLKYSDF
jgi:ADP-ribose pyrophosphatase